VHTERIENVPDLPPLSGTTYLTAWTLDVPAVAVALVLGTGYVLAARRQEKWAAGRTTAFLCGLASLVFVTCSFLGVYDTTLFWVRATQNTVLLMVTPLLLALGAPVTLLMRSASPGLAAWLRKYGRSGFARFITFPLSVTVVLIAPFLIIYFTPLYELSLDSVVVGGLVRTGLVLAGFLYFYSRVQLDPTPREGSHLVSVWISFTEVVFDGALGLVLWLGPVLAPAHYAAVHREWGPDQRTDQIVGAGVLWIGGDLAGLPFVGALFLRWSRDDEKRAKRLDRKLDEEAEAGEAPAKGLWWENDPELAQRFRRQP